MPNRLKQFILLPIIGMALAATPILAFKGNKNVSSSYLDESGVFISESTPYDGCVFYPASYSSNITGEPNYSTQNGYTFSCMNYVAAPRVIRGESVKVAVIDSGINYDHEDFKNSGTSIVKGDSRCIEYNSGWYYYSYSSNPSKLSDSLGHGTNVAGVIASQINAVGCAGIAPNVDLYVYKVTNSDNGYEWTAIINALQYCIDNDIDVINMSFQSYEHGVEYNGSSMGASTGCSTVLADKLTECYNAGITLVAAAGNYNTLEPSYPASNDHVISIGSLAESSTTTKAGYSNLYGIDLVAPGTVYVPDKGTSSSYKKTNGTSFSAPIVTAAIALYKQLHPSATPSQIESALKASCDSISGNPSWAGSGRLNIDNFLELSSSDVYPESVSITNVSGTHEMDVGDTFQLECEVLPSNTTNKTVHYYTDPDYNDIITVTDSGLVTAIGEGEALIEVYSDELNFISDIIQVNVTASSTYLKTISVNTNPSKTTYIEGNLFDPSGLKINLNYSDSTSEVVTYSAGNASSFTFNPSLSTQLTTSNHSVTVTYSGLSTTIPITVNAKSVTSLSLSGSYKTSFTVGDTFSFGGTVTANYDNNTSENVTGSASFTGYNMSNAGNQTVTVSYGGQSTTYQITVSAQSSLENGHYERVTPLTSNTQLVVGDYYMLCTAVQYNNKYWYVPASDEVVYSGDFSDSSGTLGSTTTPTSLSITDSGYRLESTTNGQFKLSSYLNKDLYLYTTSNNNGLALNTSTYATSYWETTFNDNKVAFKYYSTSKYISGYNTSPYGFRTYGGTGTNGSAYLALYHWVVDAEITSISVKTSPKTSYESDETFDPTGLIITVNYDDNTSKDVSYASESSEFSFSPSLSTVLKTTDESVSITYKNHSVSLPITVTKAKVLSSISISGYLTSFVEGDTFTFGGTVTANFDDSTSENVTEDASFTGYSMTTLGNQTVTVSYSYKGVNKTQTYQITVNAGTLDHISLSGQTTTYTKNALFSFDGTCTAHFENGYSKTVTPTNVTSPDMTSGGQKEVTVSFTYNGKTESSSYNITVNAYREVIEEQESETLRGSVVYTSGSEVKSGVSTSKSGYTNQESNALRLGSGSNTGTLTVTLSSGTFNRVKINVKSYSSDSDVSIDIGTKTQAITSTLTEYVLDFSSNLSSIAIKTKANSKRAMVASVYLYTVSTTNVDIGQSDDCVGLETFINTYMHMDYTQNLGYCKDEEHHYYSDAKTAFNALNTHQRLLFTSNSAYANEWARLQAWAGFNGDSLNNSNQLAANITSNRLDKNVDTSVLIILISSISVISLLGIFIFKKKKNK